MRKLSILVCSVAAVLISCGGSKPVKTSTSPLDEERQMRSERTERLIENKVVRPDWQTAPRVVTVKPVWIPPVIRRIYIPPHIAPDGSMVAGYYVWKKVIPGRWRKPGEKVGTVPVVAEYRSRENQQVAPQDAEAIINFLKKYKGTK